MSKNQSLYWLVGIVVVVGIIAAVYITQGAASSPATDTSPVATTTAAKPAAKPAQPPLSDPHAGWQTYANTQYGFSIQYPQRWAMKDVLDSPGSLTGTGVHIFSASFDDPANSGNNKSFGPNGHVGFQFNEPNTGSSLEEMQAGCKLPDCIAHMISIGGVPALTITNVNTEASNNIGKSVYLIKGDVMYSFDTGFGGAPQTSVEDVASSNLYIDQIASTFRFTR